MQVKDSSKTPEDKCSESKAQAQKKLVEELKAQWKLLWGERFDDKLRAEGISVDEYAALFVERGAVIHATKDFKALNFKEILEKHLVENPERYVAPDVNVGGWNKFIKAEIKPGKQTKGKRAAAYRDENCPKKGAGQHSKKGGRGWLHSV